MRSRWILLACAVFLATPALAHASSDADTDPLAVRPVRPVLLAFWKKSHWKRVGSALRRAGRAIKRGMRKAWSRTKRAARKVWSKVKRSAKKVGRAVARGANRAWDQLQSWLNRGINWAAKKIANSRLIQQIYKKVHGSWYIGYRDKKGKSQRVELPSIAKIARKPSRALLRLAARFKRPKAVASWKTSLSRLRPAVNLKRGFSMVKNQWWRGTCVAHAALAAMEYAFRKRPSDLSEQYAYWKFKDLEQGKERCSSGYYTMESAKTLHDNGVPTENAWPYQWLDIRQPFRHSCFTKQTYGTPPRGAKGKARYYVKSFVLIPNAGTGTQAESIRNPAYLMSVLGAGYPVVLGLGIAGSGWKLWKQVKHPVIDVEVDKNRKPLPVTGGHAVVLVGYDMNKKAFLIRNSWGAWWGNAGYSWLTFDYLRTYAKGGYYITGAARK